MLSECDGRIGEIGRSAVDYKLFRAIGIKCADYLSARVVEHHGFPSELGIGGCDVIPALCEERFVLFDDPALVVVDLPAADDDVHWIARLARTSSSLSNWRGLIHREDGFPKWDRQKVYLLLECVSGVAPAKAVGILDGFYRGVTFGRQHTCLAIVMNALNGAHEEEACRGSRKRADRIPCARWDRAVIAFAIFTAATGKHHAQR